MSFSRSLIATAATAAALVAPAAASAASCQSADVVPTSANAATVRHATLCLLNQQRAAHRLPRLRESTRLRSAAQGYTWAMVRHDFFDHVSPGGSTLLGRVRSTAYLARARGWSLGENIAWGAGSLATPRATMRAWMKSAGHRHNILTRRFDEVGIGIVAGAPVDLPAGMNSATYTTDFGTRG